MQQLTIAPDGSWIYTDKRTNEVQQGKLTPAQRQDLAGLMANPGLLREARATPAAGVCADAFIYTVLIGEMSMRYEQCGGQTQRPLTDAILKLVVDATPL